MIEDSRHEAEVCGDRWRDEIAAYALGALNPIEIAPLEAHLAGCPRCAERARWLQPAVDLLPASVTQLEPPRELRESLMAAVRAEAAPDPTAAAATGRNGVGERLRGWLDGLAVWRRRPAGTPLIRRPALAALAAGIVVAAAITGYELRGDADPGTGVRVVEIAPTSPRLEADGSLQLRGDSGVIRLSSLPQLPRDEVYQAWVRTGQTVEPSSVFVPNKGGASTAEIGSGLEGADQVMITREPAGGSESPQTAVILRARLS